MPLLSLSISFTLPLGQLYLKLSLRLCLSLSLGLLFFLPLVLTLCFSLNLLLIFASFRFLGLWSGSGEGSCPTGTHGNKASWSSCHLSSKSDLTEGYELACTAGRRRRRTGGWEGKGRPFKDPHVTWAYWILSHSSESPGKLWQEPSHPRGLDPVCPS